MPFSPFVTDNHTFINPLGMIFTLLMGLLLLVLPRKYAPLPILAMVCYMTMGLRLIIGGLNFTMIRVLLAFGLVRFVLRGEYKGITLNKIDRVVLWFTVVNTIAYVVLWGGEYDSFKYKSGKAYDTLGFYFLFRGFIRDWDDVLRLVKLAAIVVMPLAAEMLMEWITLVNRFAVFGGVGSSVWVRDGTPRCQGPFSHPILAGTFGATLLPCFVGLLLVKRNVTLAICGICSATIITLAAGSSGPLMAAVSAGAAFCLWPMRFQMKTFRWGVSLLLISLHMVMKAPVWFLVGRLSVHNSSDGFHRAQLIDSAIRNFSDWWLVGTRSTAQWGYFMFDVTNQYILSGVEGGFISMALFVAILVACFRAVGRMLRLSPEQSVEGLPQFAWALGAALMAHASSFIAVSYFDQNLIMWYMLLAVFASLSGVFLDRNLGVPVPEPATKTDAGLTQEPAYS
jgi:hypothetical protein